METLLLIIFWIILIFYLFKLAIRYVLPWFVKRYIRNMQRNMHDYNQKTQQQQGGMKVRQSQKDEPKIDPDVGEYVDFEEIKDNNKTE